jgi:hypothetical protein
MSGEGLLPNDPNAGPRIHVSKLGANHVDLDYVDLSKWRDPSAIIEGSRITAGTVDTMQPRLVRPR